MDDDRLSELPIELLHTIAEQDEKVYRGMLAVPKFARALTPPIRVGYMIRFGYDVTIKFGMCAWHKNHILHRIGAPALIKPSIFEDYYLHGSLWHRKSYICIDKLDYEAWYKNQVLHREDGPAIIYYGEEDIYAKTPNQRKEYWLEGKFYKKEQWEEKLKSWY